MYAKLFTPGPTSVPPEVTLAMAAPLPHHRTPEFQEIMKHTTVLLQRIYRTADPVVILSSSGTGAMEAAVANLTHPAEKVLAVNAGKFGQRWGELLRVYGRDLYELHVPWGESPDPAEIRQRAREHGARSLFVTHSETSTGALADLEAIAGVARELDALLVADAITSLGVHPVETDAWSVDCVVGGSQKAFMMPPGLAFLSVGERARARLVDNPTPRYYFDLERALQLAPKGQSPWTPAISLVLGLERSCVRILDEGLERCWERHRVLSEAVRAGLMACGLRPMAKYPSHAVTAAAVPQTGGGAPGVIAALWQRFGIKVAGGQEDLKGKIVRIGHVGALEPVDVLLLLGALEEVLRDLGHAVPAVGAIQSAAPILQQLEDRKSTIQDPAHGSPS